MLIDGNSINGIFLYTSESSQVEFEKNDFVVSGDCIYICTAANPTNLSNNTVSGIDPKDDINNENFKPYPGAMTTSADEFFNYVKYGNSGEVEDKYVSSRSLVGILQRFQFGLSMTGIIEDYIDSDGISSLTLNSISDNPINNLMLTEDLNNGVVRVSPLLSYFNDDKNKIFSTMFGHLSLRNVESNQYSLILRQYTYITSSTSTNTEYARVQELMSPVAGFTYYRAMYWNSTSGFPKDGGKITEWRSAYTYQSNLKDRLDVLLNFYQNTAEKLTAEVESVRGAFRFREINLTPEVGSSSYRLNLDEISSSNIIKLTLILQVLTNSSVSLQQSVTISFNKNSYGSAVNISLPDLNNCTILYYIDDGNVGVIDVNTSESTATIVDAYYREYYGN